MRLLELGIVEPMRCWWDNGKFRPIYQILKIFQNPNHHHGITIRIRFPWLLLVWSGTKRHAPEKDRTTLLTTVARTLPRGFAPSAARRVRREQPLFGLRGRCARALVCLCVAARAPGHGLRYPIWKLAN